MERPAGASRRAAGVLQGVRSWPYLVLAVHC